MTERKGVPMADAPIEEEYIEDVLEGDEPPPETLDKGEEPPQTGAQPGEAAPGEAAPATGAPPAAPAEPAKPSEFEPVYDPALGRWRDPVTNRFVAPPKGAKPPEAAPAAAPAAPGGPAEAQPEASSEEAEYPPFRYRAGTQALELEGSRQGEDGIFVPTEQLPDLARRLSHAVLAEENTRNLQRMISTSRADAEEARTRFDTLLGKLNELAQDPETFTAWVENLRSNWPLLVAQAENAALKKRGELLTQEHESWQSERESENLQPECAEHLEHEMRRLAALPNYQGVDLAPLWERLSGPLFQQVFVQGPEAEIAQAMPNGVKVATLRNGEIVAMNPAVIEREFQYVASIRGNTAKAVSEAAKKNAAAVATSGAPPAVAAAGGAPPAASGEALPTFKTREEMEEWFEQQLQGAR